MLRQRFQAICSSDLDSNIIPCRYGLRYIAKCLRNLLRQKFPETDEDEVLKVSYLKVTIFFKNFLLCTLSFSLYEYSKV